MDSVAGTDSAGASSSLSDTLTSAGHDAVEVHAVDTNTRVVLDTQIDVFVDTESEVSALREVPLPQFVFLDLESTLQDFLGLGSTDGDVDGNLFVTTDTEGSDGVAGLAVDWGLTRQLLEHLGGTGKSVTRFTDTDVEHKLLDAEFPHDIGGFVGHCECWIW